MALDKNAKIKLRKDILSKWEDNNPVLMNGEIAITSALDGKNSFKIGDGLNQWSGINEYSLFLSGKELKDYTDTAILTRDRTDEVVIHPFSAINDVNADFTCNSSVDNAIELQDYIDTLPAKTTIRFAKGNYLFKSSINFGDSKIVSDFGAIFTCYSTETVDFFLINSGEIDGCNFVFDGVSTIQQVGVYSTNGTIKNCKFKDFAVSIVGGKTIENNYFENINIFSINASNSIIRNNMFNLGTSSIQCAGKNTVINNYVGQVKLEISTASVSVNNMVTLATSGVTGNKVFDTVII